MEFGSLAYFLFLSVLLISGNTRATKVASPVCLIRTLRDIGSLRGDLCYSHLLKDSCTPRVSQVAGTNGHKALSLRRKGNCIYSAWLFYAEWCPFTESTRQIFDQLSILFPDICHLAVGSSGLWPSELSEHGVRSLPAIVLRNRTSRFQFHGPRYLETLSRFYEDKTGLMQVPLSFYLDEVSSLPRKQAASEGRSWKNQFLVWIWDDIYLSFAIIFVMLRSFLYVQPKVAATFKHYWLLKGTPSRALVGSSMHGPAERRKRRALVADRSNGKCLREDDREIGKGVLSVSSWPSSSLAAVALAECSSRGPVTEDTTKRTVNGA